MKKYKLLFGTFLVLSMLVLLCMAGSLSVSAAIPAGGLYVADVEVTEANAADILGDGTASYDAATKTLTLKDAEITVPHIVNIYGEDSYFGVYSEITGLKIRLVGENVFRIMDPSDTDTAAAIFSAKSLEISGEGSLSVSCWLAVQCMGDLLVRDCQIESSTLGFSAQGTVTAEGATLSADYALISTDQSDIVIKNTTVTEAGFGYMFYTEAGDITVEDSSLTTNNCEAAVLIGEGGGTLTVKNTVLDIGCRMYAVMSPTGKGVFEGVSGSIETRGEIAYGMYFGSDLTIKDCDLSVSCRATDDGAGALCADGDILIQNSKLALEARGAKDSALVIGSLESPSATVTAENSELKIEATGNIATAMSANTVKLTDCKTEVDLIANNNGEGFAIGIMAAGGSAVIQGGLFEVSAIGPAGSAVPTCGILMQNELVAPQIVNAEVKIVANQAFSTYPDLSLYNRNHGIYASPDADGGSETDFTKENLEIIRFLHIYPLYTVLINGNGGEGEMLEFAPLYGEYTLPENGFEAPEDKIFKGWALSADGEVLAGESIVLSDDITLYAIWENIASEPENPENLEKPENPENPSHIHSFGSEWKQDSEKHYRECACGAKQFEGEHTDSNQNGSCDICGTEMPADGLGTGAIVGIVCACVVLLGGGGFALYWFAFRKKEA